LNKKCKEPNTNLNVGTNHNKCYFSKRLLTETHPTEGFTNAFLVKSQSYFLFLFLFLRPNCELQTCSGEPRMQKWSCPQSSVLQTRKTQVPEKLLLVWNNWNFFLSYTIRKVNETFVQNYHNKPSMSVSQISLGFQYSKNSKHSSKKLKLFTLMFQIKPL